MSRRYFSPEFKLEVASRVLDEGLTVPLACEAFAVGPMAIHRWVKQLARECQGDAPRR